MLQQEQRLQKNRLSQSKLLSGFSSVPSFIRLHLVIEFTITFAQTFLLGPIYHFYLPGGLPLPPPALAGPLFPSLPNMISEH